MAENEPVAELDDRFSSPGATARPWSEVAAVLAEAEMFWLSTIRGDGRPHVTPLPAIWLDGALHFCTGPAEQKTRNLDAHPDCVLTTGTDRYRSGLDAVLEGRAVAVADQSLLARLAARWKEKLDWTYYVVDGGFTQDGIDQVAAVYAVAPTKVLAFGKGEPFSQTRYRWAEGTDGPW